MEEGHPQRWRILAIMCTCLILVVAGVSSLNLAIPSIIKDLEPSSTETLWIVDAYALVFAGLLLPAGALGDRYGRKKALLVGLGILIAGALWSAWSSSALLLILARASMGIGAALIMPATLSILVAVFPLHERNKAIAMWAGFAGAGGAIGIIVGGALLEKFWWGSVFFINVPIALIAGGLIYTIVPSSRDEEERPLDVVGSLLSIGGLGALVYGIIEGGEYGWTAPPTVGAFIASALFLAAWMVWERRIAHPMLDPQLFRRRPFSLGSLSISSGFAVMFGMFFLISQFFQFVQGHSPLSAGLRNLPFAAAMIIVSPRSPRLVGKIGTRLTVTLGLVIQAMGFFVFTQLEIDSSFWFVSLGLVLAAGGMGLVMPPSSASIVSSVPPNKAGVGSAWNDTTREVGGALGIAVMGTVFASGYRAGIKESSSRLPDELAEFVNDGIGGALQVAQQTNMPEIIAPAQAAFVDGMVNAMGVATAVGLTAAAVVFVAYPRIGHEPEAVSNAPAQQR